MHITVKSHTKHVFIEVNRLYINYRIITMSVNHTISWPSASERLYLVVSRTTLVLAIFWQLPVVFRRKDQILH